MRKAKKMLFTTLVALMAGNAWSQSAAVPEELRPYLPLFTGAREASEQVRKMIEAYRTSFNSAFYVKEKMNYKLGDDLTKLLSPYDFPKGDDFDFLLRPLMPGAEVALPVREAPRLMAEGYDYAYVYRASWENAPYEGILIRWSEKPPVTLETPEGARIRPTAVVLEHRQVLEPWGVGEDLIPGGRMGKVELELEWVRCPDELGSPVNRLKSITKKVRIARMGPDGEHRPIALTTTVGKLVEVEEGLRFEMSAEGKIVLSDDEYYTERATASFPLMGKGRCESAVYKPAPFFEPARITYTLEGPEKAIALELEVGGDLTVWNLFKSLLLPWVKPSFFVPHGRIYDPRSGETLATFEMKAPSDNFFSFCSEQFLYRFPKSGELKGTALRTPDGECLFGSEDP